MLTTALITGGAVLGASVLGLTAVAWGPVPPAPPLEQVANSCAQGTAPVAVEAILLDRDAPPNENPTTRLQKENVRAKIQKIIDEAKPGTVVVVYQLTDKPAEPLIKHVAACRPSTEANVIWEAQNAGQRRLVSAYLNPLAQGINAAMVERKNDWTPLAEGIAAISSDIDFHADKPSVPKRVHVFSDMIVNMDGKCRAFSTGILNKGCRDYALATPAQLTNTSVFLNVLYRTLDNPKVQQGSDLQTYWTDYARSNGATHIDWQVLR